MPRLLFDGKIASAISALNAVSAILGWEVLKGGFTTMYVHFGPGTSAGTIVIEGAHSASFTGTWANLATIAWAAADRTHNFAVGGNHRAIRARVSVALVGGTADVYATVTE